MKFRDIKNDYQMQKNNLLIFLIKNVSNYKLVTIKMSI